MRTILSLSLAAFALALPVARPHAVDGHGGVGTSCLSQYALCTSLIDFTFVLGLIGRDDFFSGIGLLVNGALKGTIDDGFFTQDGANLLISQIDGIVNSAGALAKAGGSALDGPTIDSFGQQITDVVESALLAKVDGGFLDRNILTNLLANLNQILVSANKT